jgi:aminopeptidase N
VATLGRGAELAFALEQTPKLLSELEDYFGIAYPYDKLDLIAVPDFGAGAMENAGAITFRDTLLLLRPDASENQKRRLAYVNAHELAHQWFGNSLTVARWKDIWLHEGFACYAEWLWSEESGKDSAHERARHHWARLSDLDQDLVLADPGPDLMFDDRVYKRGALTLHALRLTVGDEPFFALLRAWAGERAFSTVSTDEFIAFVADRVDKDVTGLFEAWLSRPELPELPSAS